MSKKIKSIVAMLLAMVMVLAMGMPAFAAGTGAKSVAVDFKINAVPAGTDTSLIPSSDKLSSSYYFDNTSNALKAIEAVAEELSTAKFGTGTDSNGTYIDSIFGLTTVNNYDDYDDEGNPHYWEGYYWNIKLTVKQADGSSVEIDAPYYADSVLLGTTQEFKDYTEKVIATGEVTAITLTYMHDTLEW